MINRVRLLRLTKSSAEKMNTTKIMEPWSIWFVYFNQAGSNNYASVQQDEYSKVNIVDDGFSLLEPRRAKRTCSLIQHKIHPKVYSHDWSSIYFT